MNKKKRVILLLAAAAFLVTGGCFSLNPDNFIPESIAPTGHDRRIDGTVNVQAFVPNISKSRVALYQSGTLRGALEKAIAQKGLFQGIKQGNADYVLDVWVTDAKREIKAVDGYMIDVTSIWRLTRTKDGTIIVCDFANGHGASHAVGTNAFVNSLETATREMIQKGLFALSDRKTPLAALYVAGSWPSMGRVITEGYRLVLKEREKEIANWSKLRKGMTEEEARTMMPSMVNAPRNSSIQMDSRRNFYRSEVVYKHIYPLYFENNYPLPSYNLWFVNGVLERWELHK